MSKEKSEASTARVAEPAAADSTPSDRAHIPLLLVLFIGSGCAALIYEIVWFQLLQLVVGSSAVSLGVLLGTYMGGMCLGSLLLPRYVSARGHPLRVYAIIEGGIGVCGLLVLLILPLLDHLYAAIGGSGLLGILLRALVAAVCLLPPTLLMGASLPAIARYVESSSPGLDFSMAATSPARCLDACSRVFICFASTTCRRQRTSPPRSTQSPRCSAIAFRRGPATSRLPPPIRLLLKLRHCRRRKGPFTSPSACPG